MTFTPPIPDGPLPGQGGHGLGSSEPPAPAAPDEQAAQSAARGPVTSESVAGAADPGAGPGSAPRQTTVSGRPGDNAWKRSMIEWTLVIAGALLIAFTLRATSFQVFYIPSGSMEPTLQISDRVVVNEWSYRLHSVNRGDIVVFLRPAGETAVGVNDLIKRVVGLPGETVTISNNQVLINGAVLDEPYLPSGTRTIGTGTPIPCAPTSPCVIPSGEVWVMGDNRSQSADSRFFGPIPESKIVGRAFMRLWPLGRLGGL